MRSASTLKKPIETVLVVLMLVSPTIGYSEAYGVGGYEFLHLRFECERNAKGSPSFGDDLYAIATPYSIQASSFWRNQSKNYVGERILQGRLTETELLIFGKGFKSNKAKGWPIELSSSGNKSVIEHLKSGLVGTEGKREYAHKCSLKLARSESVHSALNKSNDKERLASLYARNRILSSRVNELTNSLELAQSGSSVSNPDAQKLVAQEKDLKNTIREQQTALDEKTSKIEVLEAALLEEQKHRREEAERKVSASASDAERIAALERELEEVKRLSEDGNEDLQLSETKTEATRKITQAPKALTGNAAPEPVEQVLRTDTQPLEREKSISSKKLVDPMESVAGLLNDKKNGQQVQTIISKVEENLASSAMSFLQKGLSLPTGETAKQEEQITGNQAALAKETSRHTEDDDQNDRTHSENYDVKNTFSETNVDELHAEIKVLIDNEQILRSGYPLGSYTPQSYVDFEDKEIVLAGTKPIYRERVNCGKALRTIRLSQDGRGSMLSTTENKTCNLKAEYPLAWASKNETLAFASKRNSSMGDAIMVEQLGLNFHGNQSTSRQFFNIDGERSDQPGSKYTLVSYQDLATGESLPLGGEEMEQVRQADLMGEYNKAIVANFEKKTRLFGIRLLDDPKIYKVSNKKEFKEQRPIIGMAGATLTELLKVNYDADVKWYRYRVDPPINNSSFAGYEIQTVSVNGTEAVYVVRALADIGIPGVNACSEFGEKVDAALAENYGFRSGVEEDFQDETGHIYTLKLASMCTVDGRPASGNSLILDANGLLLNLFVIWTQESLMQKFGIDPSTKKRLDTKF